MSNPIGDELARIVQEEFEKRNPERAAHHFSLGEEAFQRRDFLGAAQHYQIAFNNDPRPDYLRKKGNSLLYGRKPEEGLEAHTEAITLKHKGMSSDDIQRLLRERVKPVSMKLISEAFKEWEKLKIEDPRKSYENAASRLEGMYYTLDDVVAYVSDTTNIGIFLSALSNQIMKKDDILTLRTGPYISYVGAFHERGTLVIDQLGSTDEKFSGRNHFAYGMRGGKVIIKCNPGHDYGDEMEDGELVIEGVVRESGFTNMKGGHGVIKSIDPEGIYLDGICQHQKGGTLEILCDVPRCLDRGLGSLGIGVWQEGEDAKLIIIGNVYCNVNTWQKGGTTYIKGNLGGGNVTVGHSKEGGETIIDGNVLGSGHYRPVVGYMTAAGKISVTGEVHGSVAYDCGSRTEIEIGKNVDGDIGNSKGANVRVKGNVTGNVGPILLREDDDVHFYCTVDGDVHGNIENGIMEVNGNVYGNINGLSGNSHITVRKNVTGEVGRDNSSRTRVDVGGSIGAIGPSMGGRMYQRGEDVTKYPIVNRILNRMFGN